MKATVTAERVGNEWWAIISSLVPLPTDVFAVEGANRVGGYCVKLRLTEPERWDSERRMYVGNFTVDFTRLGIVLDMVRDVGVEVDLSAVPGWKVKGIGG